MLRKQMTDQASALQAEEKGYAFWKMWQLTLSNSANLQISTPLHWKLVLKKRLKLVKVYRSVLVHKEVANFTTLASLFSALYTDAQAFIAMFNLL